MKLFILTVLLLFGWHVKGDWTLYSWGKNGYKPTSTGTTFTFPQTNCKKIPAFPAFLTTTDSSVVGDLTGRTLSASLTVDATGSPAFIYGGWCAGWNSCATPANTRFFITDRTGAYNLTDANRNPNAYWWSHDGVATISESTGTVTISASVDPARWSNAVGQFAKASSTNLAAFTAIVQNVRQAGLAFGGGCFFDVGVAVRTGTGSAAFHLNSFSK